MKTPLEPIKLHNIIINPPLFLAPMAAITTPETRYIAELYGASITYTEMISAAALFRGVNAAKRLIKDTPSKNPFATQIFGSDPHEMEFSAWYLAQSGVDIIDINMGCPMKDIVRHGAGAALMKNTALASKIVKSVIKGVDGKIPVTVKIRAGWDFNSLNAAQFALAMEESGASLITVHGRTRSQMYTGKSNPEIIKEVVDTVSVPVIANGDVKNGADAVSLLEQTNAKGIMVARGSFGNPWIFSEINSAMKGEDIPDPPTVTERIDVMKKHIKLTIASNKNPAKQLIEIKKQISWYSKTLKDSSIFRNRIFRSKSVDEVMNLILELQE